MDGWTSDDDFFGPARIDVDERREQPAPHRYVHGSFEGTETKFAVHLPDAYEGRLIQFLQGGTGGNELAGASGASREVAFQSGALLVESNQGHTGNLAGVRGAPTVLNYRASRQAALFASALAEEHYGDAPRFRYLYGGSGGGLRAIECAEQCPGLWDGVIPFIINRNGFLIWNFSVLAWASFALQGRYAQILDATDAGGSGDPFAGLDEAQQDALATIYRAGYCRGAESQLAPSPQFVLGMQVLRGVDRTYFEQFWTEPGLEGHDGSAFIDRHLVEGQAQVRAVLTAGEVQASGDEDDLLSLMLAATPADRAFALVLDGDVNPSRLLGATMRVTSGAAAGRSFSCTGAMGDGLTATLNPGSLEGIAVGDTIAFDNRDLIAFAHHHRHYVNDAYPEMRQFFVDGVPLHAQRERNMGMNRTPSGRFEGRMIIVQNAADRECWPNCARAYVDSVQDVLGDALDDRFRIWWTEHAPHVVPAHPSGRTHLVDYAGMYNQALSDMIAWVEDGVAPPASTRFSFSDDNALLLPAAADERLGIQPVVRAAANGGIRAEVQAGEPVALTVEAELAPGTGSIVGVEWDLDGSGEFATTGELHASVSHTWNEPGTYFATVRVSSHRSGDADDRYRRISNIGRARIVVH